MPLSALLLALGAAFLHAGWNVLLAGSDDSEVAAGALLVWGVALLAPPALLTGGVESEALPFVAASAALELAYFALLARAYREGELSVIYPVARGSAPVIVLVAGALLLGEHLSTAAVAGVLAVTGGVFLVQSGPARRRDVLFGLAIGVVIAAYSIVDAEGVERARPVAYLVLVVAPAALVYVSVLVARGRGPELRAALGARSLLVAALSFGAFLMVLAAFRLADTAPVVAVRESSVVMAALLAGLFLHEPVGRGRLAGAALVAAGVAAIAYS